MTIYDDVYHIHPHSSSIIILVVFSYRRKWSANLLYLSSGMTAAKLIWRHAIRILIAKNEKSKHGVLMKITNS